MPVKKCPACGYPNTQAAQICTNCEKKLFAYLPPPSASSSAEAQGAVLIPGELEGRRAFPVVVSPLEEFDSPYRTTVQDKTLESFIPTISATSQKMPGIDAWKAERLPPGFPFWRPRLFGTIIQIDTREQVNEYPNFLGALLSIFTEIIWSIFNVQTTRDAVDRIEVTRLRIQTDNGATQDATIRGSLRGANLTMGDIVSLWGWQRRGNLIVRKGYDYTSHSTISTSATGVFLPALLLIALSTALYLVVSGTSPSTFWHHILALPAWFKNLVLSLRNQ